MDYFPVFLDLRGRKALVVGGTDAAAQKARLLRRAQAQVVVVEPDPGPAMAAVLAKSVSVWHARPFRAEDLEGAAIAISASAQAAVDEAVHAAATARGVPVNVVDRTGLCSFIMPAFVDRSPVLVAISSGAASPVLARLIRARIEALLPPATGRLAAWAGTLREHVAARLIPSRRRRFWEEVLEGVPARLLLAGDTAGARRAMEAAIEEHAGSAARGEVWVVPITSPDPDLLTCRALRLMQRCDVVLYDPGVPGTILDRVRRDAEQIPVLGPSPAGRLVEFARNGQRALWLAVGASLFDRPAALQPLLRAGVPLELVPCVVLPSTVRLAA